MTPNDSLPNEPADRSLDPYLASQGAELVHRDGVYAISVHGTLDIDGRAVPFHLVPDEGALGKSAKWRKLDAAGRLALVTARINPETRARLEAQIAACARDVIAEAERHDIDPAPALVAFQAKYELARIRCQLARDRIEARQVRNAATRQARQTSDAINLALYPESFELAHGMQRHFIAVLGPTNSGKTHAAMEHLARAATGVYLAPLRLLALENYHRLLDAGVAASLVTGEQRKLHPHGTHVASTVEMLNTQRVIDVAVIDEIQLLDDPDRGAAWTAAVCGVPAHTIYLLGAPEAREAIEALVRRVGGTLEVRTLERKTKLAMDKAPLGSLANLQTGDVLIAFSRRDVLNWRDKVIERGMTVSAIYGSLSPEVRQAQAERFLEGKAQVVVATDAIGMGLNTPARRVIFTTARKWDGDMEGPLPAALTRQIAGRAGRFGQHETGFVAGIDPQTHKAIADLLRQKPEPLPTGGFFVAPGIAQLRKIGEATGESRLKTLLELFTRHINVHDAFFVPASLDDQMEKAAWLDALPLPLEDRFTFSLCPVSSRIAMLDRALKDWAQLRARRKKAPLLRMEGMGGRHELQYLEDSCKLYAAYAWLGYRMPETFPDGEMAQALMLSASERIDALLQAQNHKKRRRNDVPPHARRRGR